MSTTGLSPSLSLFPYSPRSFVPISRILETWNPFLALRLVKESAAENLAAAEPKPYAPSTMRGPTWHWGRIRYLMENPTSDPILVLQNKAGVWYVHDGNHRLCAAILTGHETILASSEGALLT